MPDLRLIEAAGLLRDDSVSSAQACKLKDLHPYSNPTNPNPNPNSNFNRTTT